MEPRKARESLPLAGARAGAADEAAALLAASPLDFLDGGGGADTPKSNPSSSSPVDLAFKMYQQDGFVTVAMSAKQMPSGSLWPATKKFTPQLMCIRNEYEPATVLLTMPPGKLEVAPLPEFDWEKLERDVMHLLQENAATAASREGWKAWLLTRATLAANPELHARLPTWDWTPCEVAPQGVEELADAGLVTREATRGIASSLAKKSSLAAARKKKAQKKEAQRPSGSVEVGEVCRVARVRMHLLTSRSCMLMLLTSCCCCQVVLLVFMDDRKPGADQFCLSLVSEVRSGDGEADASVLVGQTLTERFNGDFKITGRFNLPRPEKHHYEFKRESVIQRSITLQSCSTKTARDKGSLLSREDRVQGNFAIEARGEGSEASISDSSSSSSDDGGTDDD